MEGYTIIKRIGVGAFGPAKLARKKETIEKCVIKVINMSYGDGKNEVKVVQRAIDSQEFRVAADKGDTARLEQLLKKCYDSLDLGTIQHSPNIIKLLETAKNNKEFCVAADKGDAARLEQLLIISYDDLNLGTIQRVYENSVNKKHSPNIIKLLETAKNNKEFLVAADKGDAARLEQLLAKCYDDLNLGTIQRVYENSVNKKHSPNIIKLLETAKNNKIS